MYELRKSISTMAWVYRSQTMALARACCAQRIEVIHTYPAVGRKVFYHLRQMRSVCRSLSVDATKTLVNAFLTSWIDYSNNVFSRVAATHLHPLQSVLNAAGRQIVKKRKIDTITAIVRDVLHWLPIPQRIEYKLPDLSYKENYLLPRTAVSFLQSVEYHLNLMSYAKDLSTSALLVSATPVQLLVQLHLGSNLL